MMTKNECNHLLNESPPTYSLHQHACITLNSSDRFRLIQFPSTIIDIIRQTINTSWPRGIQKEEEENYLGTYEFKLHGNPWWGQGDEAISSRVLMFNILSALYHHGWYLLTSTDISKKQLDKDSLIFQQGIIPLPTTFFAISFNEFDKLRLIGVSPEIVQAIQQSFNSNDIQREEWIDEGIAYQFKLRGSPWICSGKEGIETRIKLLSILDCLTRFGFKLYASIDMSKGHESRDTDTWFFRRDIQ